MPAYALDGKLTTDTAERRLFAVLGNVGNQLMILTVPAVAFGVFFVNAPGFPKPQLNPAPYPGFGLIVAGLAGVLMLASAIGAGQARSRRAKPPLRMARTAVLVPSRCSPAWCARWGSPPASASCCWWPFWCRS